MRYIISTLLLLSMILMSSCKDDNNPKYYTADGFIRDSGIIAADGCGWTVNIDDNNYHPVNLDLNYQIDNLPVRITYRYDDTPFICGIAGKNMQSIYIKKIQVLTRDCDQFGTIYDYTGLSGCGFVIRTDNGETMEIVEVVPNFTLEDGMRVKFSYTDLLQASICMVGKTIRIDCITEVKCDPITDNFTHYDYLKDPVNINKVYIMDDCLKINLTYSGGCEEHDFKLVRYYPTCGTPPIDRSIRIALSHDSKDDMCDALIGKELSFDLSSLRDSTKNSVEFFLNIETYNGTKNYTLNYNYR